MSISSVEEISLPKSSDSLGPDVGRITSDGSPLLLEAHLPPSQADTLTPEGEEEGEACIHILGEVRHSEPGHQRCFPKKHFPYEHLGQLEVN